MADHSKIYDDEINAAMDGGKLVKRGNSTMWDPSVSQPSDEEVLAALGLDKNGTPLNKGSS